MIEDILPRYQEIANGNKTDFTVPFDTIDSSYINVYLNKIKQTSGFSVSDKVISFTTAPTTNTIVTIVRVIPISWEQEVLGAINKDSLNKVFTQIIAKMQTLEEEVNRSLKTDITDTEINLSEFISDLSDAIDSLAQANNKLIQIQAVSTQALSDISDSKNTALSAITSHASSKTNEFDSNAMSKTTSFNNNYTEKKALIDVGASTAQTAATTATNQANLAKQYAIGDPSEPTEHSAKYWADKAETELAGLTSRVTTIEGKIPSSASSSNQLTDKSYVDSADNGLQTQITANTNNIDNIEDKIPAEASSLNQLADKSYVDSADNGLQSQIDALVASSDVFDIVGTYAELQAYDITTVPVNDIIKVLVDSTHSNAATYYRCVETGGVKSWSYIGAEGAYYTKAETNALLGNKQDTLVSGTNIKTFNSQSLLGSGNIDISANATWGNITGTLSNQTDLDNALRAKYDANNPNGYTSNVGTVTSVNNISPGSNGNVSISIPTVNNATLTIQKNSTNVATFTANASSNVTANISVPTKTSDLTNDNGFVTDSTLSSSPYLVLYGASTSAADATAKIVEISSSYATTPTISAGQILIVTPTITSTVADSTITVQKSSTTLLAAKTMRYNNANITTSTDSIVWGANIPSVFVYDGTYWQFLGHGLDSNTTYSAMSVSEGTTGTATSSRTMRADYLKQILDNRIQKVNSLPASPVSNILYCIPES